MTRSMSEVSPKGEETLRELDDSSILKFEAFQPFRARVFDAIKFDATNGFKNPG